MSQDNRRHHNNNNLNLHVEIQIDPDWTKGKEKIINRKVPTENILKN